MHGAPIMKEFSMPPGVRRYRVGSLHVLSVPGAVLFFDNVHISEEYTITHHYAAKFALRFTVSVE